MDTQNFAFWPVSLETADVLGHRSGAARRLFPLPRFGCFPAPARRSGRDRGEWISMCDLSNRGFSLRGRTDGLHRPLIRVERAFRTRGYTRRMVDPSDGFSIRRCGETDWRRWTACSIGLLRFQTLHCLGGIGISVRTGFLVPGQRLLLALVGAQSHLIHMAQPVLGFGAPLIGS